MKGKTNLKYTVFIAVALFIVNLSVLGFQRKGQERSLSCNNNNNWWGSEYVSHCEIREQTVSAAGRMINVDGRKNGGVSVKGWDGEGILVRTQVQTAGKSEAEAREMASQIRIETAGGQIRAEGPDSLGDSRWSASYEIFVPRQSDLTLKTYNGGISIQDVSGQIEFDALNGGVSLKRLAGNVRGHTTNGGLSVELTGDRWDGEGMDVRTTNGGVSIAIPENYSAHLETGTVNGSLNLGFPLTVQGRISKRISVDLGAGGTMVRAMTTNGGVSINRRGQN